MEAVLLNENMQLLLIGVGIGLVSAVLGAVVDYFLSRRRRGEEDEAHLPGCMLLITGALGFVGLVALAASFLFYQTVWPAVWVGVGVMTGFFVGFSLLFLGAIWLAGRQSEAAE